MNTNHTKTQLESEAGELIDHLKDYLETRSEITRLSVLDKASQGAGAAAGGLIIGFLFFLFFIFSGLALAYFLAEYTGHVYLGFISVAGIWLVAGIIFIVKKDSLIQKPIANRIIQNYFSDHE